MVATKRLVILIISLVLIFFSFIFLVVGTASNSWVRLDTTTKYGKVVQERGLWKSCSSSLGCHDYTGTSDWLRSCRALSVISCLVITLALALSALSYIEARIKGYMIAITCVASGVCMIITLVIFLTKNSWTNDEPYDYSWSFILSWVGAIFSLISAVWATLMTRLD